MFKNTISTQNKIVEKVEKTEMASTITDKFGVERKYQKSLKSLKRVMSDFSGINQKRSALNPKSKDAGSTSLRRNRGDRQMKKSKKILKKYMN